jgi:hypothetical protein
MRKFRTIVAMFATAVMLSSLVSPAVAAGKKTSPNNFFGSSFGSVFDFGGGSKSSKKGKSYQAPKSGGGSSNWFGWDDGGKKGKGGKKGRSYQAPKYGSGSSNWSGWDDGGKKGKKKGGKKGHHGGYFDITFFETPGTPYSAPTETIVYFGTCLNPAGFQMAGNAGPDGQCEPFESLVGSEGSPGTGPTCTITKTKKSHGSSASTTQTVDGSCAAYQAAKPSWTGHDKDDDEEQNPT